MLPERGGGRKEGGRREGRRKEGGREGGGRGGGRKEGGREEGGEEGGRRERGREGGRREGGRKEGGWEGGGRGGERKEGGGLGVYTAVVYTTNASSSSACAAPQCSLSHVQTHLSIHISHVDPSFVVEQHCVPCSARINAHIELFILNDNWPGTGCAGPLV